MSRSKVISVLLAILFPLCAWGQLDSTVTATLDPMLEEYFSALQAEPVGVKLEECDFMLESCTDSLVRQYVAVRLYDHFLGSKVMGDETVAVHLVDDWFIPGKVKMYDEIDLLNARIYAEFHRNSLIGKRAPVLDLLDAQGKVVTVPPAGEYSVLFFYDTSCSKCRLETILLRSFLPGVDYPLNFYAVYTGDSGESWEQYIKERWDMDPGKVTIRHLWDPEMDSDFQRQYGVLTTPQMVLVDGNGTILGRGLDTEALQTLLESVLPKPYDYGSETSMDFFGELFAGDGDVSAANILEMAEYIRNSTLERGDTLLCKHMLGDCLYFLMDSRGEEYKTALGAFISLYVEGEASLWNTEEDSLKVVRPAEVCKDLMSRTPVGSKIPGMKVRGVKLKPGGDISIQDVRTFRLRRLKGSPAYIIFHTPGCSTCEAEIAAARSLAALNPSVRVLLVNPEDNPDALLETFDLSVLPFILELDRKGIVRRKYLSLQ